MSVRMPFGKFKGEYLEDIPDSYLVWMVRECTNLDAYLRNAVRAELNRRYRREEPQPRRTYSPPVDFSALVGAARRELAMKYHPDRGGSADVMKGINLALDRVAQLAEVGS